MSPSIQLLDLPTELIIKILSLLHVADLLSCGVTNQFLQELVETSAFLQYHIACHKYGVEDNPQCALVPAARLEELYSRERAWSRLEFHAITLDMEPRSSTGGFGYNLKRGVLALSNMSESPTTLKLVICSPEEIKLSSLDLSWVHLGMDCEILDSEMSLEHHDLIVVIAACRPPNAINQTTRNIHIILMNFSTGTFHPSASRPTIFVAEQDTEEAECEITLGISGDTLVVLAAYEPFDENMYEDRIHVYNWKTGKLQATTKVAIHTYCSFSFISADIVMFPNMQTASLDLFRVSPPSFSNATPIAFVTFMILQLPTLLPDRGIVRMVCNASPNFKGRHASSDFEPAIPETRPHYSSPDNAIIVFHIDFHSDIAPPQSSSFVLHRRALLRRISALSEPSVTAPMTIPWIVWSPRARWFNRRADSRPWIPISYGQRYLQMSCNSKASLLRVVDFNPHLIQYQGPGTNFERLTSCHRWTIAHQGIFHPTHAVFADEVRNSLPFIVYESFDNYDYNGVLMDGERVIGLHASTAAFVQKIST